MRIAIIPIMALLCIPSWVRADGFAGTEQRTQIMRVRNASCPQFPNLTRDQCYRLIQKNAALGRSRSRNTVIREKIYVVDRDRDRNRNRRDRDDYQDSERSVGQCVGETYTMEGSKNAFEYIAKYNAREAWRRKVRSKHGTQFQDTNRAKNVHQRCWPEGVFTRCEFTARPCRA